MRPTISCRALGLAIFALAMPAAHAYPVIVRATSRIALAMRHEGAMMAIDGRLTRDDGTAVAGATVQMTIGQGAPVPLQTGSDGRFGWAGELSFGEVEVVARFAGLDAVEGSLERRRFQFGKADVALDIAAPARIDRSRTSVEIEVRARSDVGSGGLSIRLEDGEGRPLAQGTTSAEGLARLEVDPRAISAPGPARLEARSAADALRGTGHAVAQTTLVSASRLLLGALPPRVAADAELQVVGTLTDEEHPIPRGAIEVQVGRAPAVRTATDARGVFTATVPFDGLPRGALELRVRYQPDASWRSGVEAGPLRIEHLAPTPLPLWLLLVPLGVTAIALLLVLRASRDRLGAAARRARTQTTPVRVQGGLQPGRASDSRARASRRPPDAEIAGRVWDPTTRRAVGGALVTVRPEADGEPRSVECDASGRFATGPLPTGDYVVEATAAGYLPESFAARVPHHGELRDLRVDLVPVRHRVMEIYRDAALRVLPERELWGFWTPREILRFARKRQEARQMPLQPLTELFEEVYYADRRASADSVARAIELAAEVGVRAPQ